MMAQIAAVMIVKNEEKNLPRALASLSGAVDEIIIVDTGSTDRTVAVAHEFGATVAEHEWDDDFAAARNAGLMINTAKWVLQLDADEEFVPDSTLESHLAADSHGIRVRVGVGAGVDVISQITNYFQAIRLFRGDMGLSYEGAIHERVVINDTSKIVDSSLRIVHFGPTLPGRADRGNRNIPILRKEISKNPEDPYLLTKLGDEYMAHSNYREASECYSKAIKFADRTLLYVSRMSRDLAYCLYQIGEKISATELVFELEKLYPEYTDVFFLEGLMHVWNKDWGSAEGAFLKCIQMGNPPPSCHSWGGTGSWRAQSSVSKVQLEIAGNRVDKV